MKINFTSVVPPVEITMTIEELYLLITAAGMTCTNDRILKKNFTREQDNHFQALWGKLGAFLKDNYKEY